MNTIVRNHNMLSLAIYLAALMLLVAYVSLMIVNPAVVPHIPTHIIPDGMWGA